MSQIKEKQMITTTHIHTHSPHLQVTPLQCRGAVWCGYAWRWRWLWRLRDLAWRSAETPEKGAAGDRNPGRDNERACGEGTREGFLGHKVLGRSEARAPWMQVGLEERVLEERTPNFTHERQFLVLLLTFEKVKATN